MTYIPESLSTYQGNQVILNSDRLVFNAKNDSILLFSNKSIGFSTNNNFHFDTNNSEGSESKFIVNSPKIYLGLRYNNTLPENPAVLGNELESILLRMCNECIGALYDIHFKISYISAVEGDTTGMNPDNLRYIKNRAKNFQDIIDDIKSILSTRITIGDNTNVN